MAHGITHRKNGYVEFAALGDRKEVWHNLGQYLDEGQSIEQWQVAAGMDWEIFSSPVMFQAGMETKIDTTRNVLFRSDNQEVLSVVSEDYKIVQPSEVLEFFREFTETNQMRLSAAGTIFGGKKFWATAEMDKEASIVDGDKIKGYLLLTTSADGTMSTQARFTSTRVVCNNTLQIALGDKGKSTRKKHNSVFDPKEFKIDMGLIDAGWDAFITNLKTLANDKVTLEESQDFFTTLIAPKEKDIGFYRQFDALMYFYKNGAGAEMSYGTKWGLLNAVTEMQTHGTARTARDHQFNNSEFGKNATIKQKALELLLA